MANYGETKVVTKKNPITGKVRITKIITGAPGLQAAKVVAKMPEDIKKKQLEDKPKKENKFIPFPAGLDKDRSRRIENGGEIKRLKRKNG